MRGKKKKALARILSFILSAILVVPAHPMPEVRAEIRWCNECMEYKDCDYCQFCNRCEDCVTICDRCGEVCLECHEELEGVEEYSPCSECGRCKEGVNYCLFCGRCEDCIEMCDRCNEICLECHEALSDESVEEHSPCSDCGRCKDGVDYCLFCGRCADCVEICSECGEVCTECHEEMAAESGDESIPCPGCYKCKAGGMIYCHVCGYCEECKDFCYGCGFCMECAMEKGLHCEECEECFEMVERCPDDGMHCTDHCIICDDCGKCMLESDEEPCEYCGLCPDCCEINQCGACGMCAEDPAYEDHFCEECGACMEAEEERCEDCGLCVQCCNDRAEEMGCSCGDGCWLNLEEDHFCADCGRCFGEVDPCNTCLDAGEYRCIECCEELSEMEGCDCATPVCVNADDFDMHMATVHGGGLEGHQATAKCAWSFDANHHWHDCRLCNEAAHVSSKTTHTYNSMGICTVCGYNTTSKIVITSQPKDRHATIHYTGWYYPDPVEPVEDKDNTVSYTVVAYGKNAKKGLHYQWYCKNSNKTWTLKDGEGIMSDYCSGAKTSVLIIAVPNDACRMTDENDPYVFYCVITDDDGNSVTSAAASMIVKHDYRVYNRSNLKNAEGHVLSCVGDGCQMDSKVLPHTYGEWKWALKSDGTQSYMYHVCTVCGWRENFNDAIHEHQYDFSTLYGVDYESLTVIEENDKLHRYEYEYEYNGKIMRAGSTVGNHFVTCSVPGCNCVQREKHDWAEWHVVNYATKKAPGGLYRTCKVCGIQQTWAKTGYFWHTHPINMIDGHAKETSSDFLTLTNNNAIVQKLQKAMEDEDLDIADEGTVVLLFPNPVEGEKATGAFVRIQRVVGAQTTTTEELLEVTEIIPGVAYAFTVPKSGRIQSEEIGKPGLEVKVDYQASFIDVTFEYERCTHKSTKVKGVIAATCTEIGYTGDKVCAYCEHLIEKGTYVVPKGHAAGVPATGNVSALNASGKPLYVEVAGGEYPVYKIQVATVRTCDDIYGNKGSYTGDLICPDCGEIVEKGKYYSREHSYVLLNDMDENVKNGFIAEGYHEAVAPSKGKDGYSGDCHCSVCGEWKLGHVVKSQTISKVMIEISEMPVYGSEVKDNIFTFSEGTQAGDNNGYYYFSWFGYYDEYGQEEWARPGDVVDIKVNPALMELELRVSPKEGYWFPISADEMQIYVNGKQIRDNKEILGSGKAVRLSVIKNSAASDYGELAITVDIAMTGFCGVAYDVNGGEGNIPCLAVTKGSVVSLAECNFDAPAGMTFDHWEVNGKSYQPGDDITVNGLVVAKAVWVEKAPADIVGIAADLEGKVGLLFFVNVPDYVLADEGAYVELALEGDKKTRMISAAPVDEKNGIVRRRFGIYADSTQFNSKVNFRMYLSDGTEVPLLRKGVAVPDGGYDYSIIDYCNLAIDSLGEGTMVDLAKSLIAYGEMAQICFDHNKAGLVPDASLSDTGIDAKLAANYAPKISGEVPEGLNVTKPQGVYLVLDAATTLRVNWKFLDGADPSTYTYAINGSPATVKFVEGQYCLEVRNIPSKMLADEFAFSISKGGKTYTWTGSALSWAQIATANADETTKKIARALYRYNMASRYYFEYKLDEIPAE